MKKNIFKRMLIKMYLLPKYVGSEDFSKYTERSISIDGFKINYATAGKTKAPQVVFIHGVANDWKSWVPTSNHFLNDFKVIIPDLLGYGKSSRLKKYNFEQQSDTIAKFIQQVTDPKQPIYIVGLSMGSSIAADIAANNSKLIHKAFLNGPVFEVVNFNWATKMSNGFLALVNRSYVGPRVYKRLVNFLPFTYVMAGMFNMYKFSRELNDRYLMPGRKIMDPDVYTKMAQEVVGHKIADILTNVQIPVLLIFGKYDKLTSAHTAAKLIQKKSKNIKIEVIDKAAHSVSFERNKEVAEVIKAAINS